MYVQTDASHMLAITMLTVHVMSVVLFSSLVYIIISSAIVDIDDDCVKVKGFTTGNSMPSFYIIISPAIVDIDDDCV